MLQNHKKNLGTHEWHGKFNDEHLDLSNKSIMSSNHNMTRQLPIE
jgi:hypothetical protein